MIGRLGIVPPMRGAATPDEIADGIRRVLAANGPLDEDDLIQALRRDGLVLGDDRAAYDAVHDELATDGLGPIVTLDHGAYVWLPSLLGGRTFTHRLSAWEIEHGYVDIGPDLEALSMLTDDPTYLRLVPAGELVEVITELDAPLLTERGIPLHEVGHAAWLLDRDALSSLDLSAGELMGVTVTPSGFELSRATATDDSGAAGIRLAAALETLGGGSPSEIGPVVWEVCAESPELFTAPLRPLTDLVADEGLVTHGDWLGPPGFDFDQWHTHRRLGYLAEVHGLTEDEALAVLVMVNLYEDMDLVLEAANRAVEEGGSVDDVLGDTAGDGVPVAEGEPTTIIERPDVRATLEFLDIPAVAAALLAETVVAGRSGAPALGMFAETVLEQQPPRAAIPHLRWLLGKAHERLGDVTGPSRSTRRRRP